MEPRPRVLYDGWPLVYQPDGYAAVHLWELLEWLPLEAEPILALPEALPAWFTPPPGLALEIIPQVNTPGGRLRWEQQVIPRLAAGLEAACLHLTHPHPPLRFGAARLVSPTGQDELSSTVGMADRLRSAFGRGGAAMANAILWPADLPAPGGSAPVHRLTPFVHEAYSPSNRAANLPPEGLELPETYILYHGSFKEAALRLLLDAWTWGAGALGEYYPLLLLGAGASSTGTRELIKTYSLGSAVQLLPSLPTLSIPEVYRRASALIHPGPEVPWGGAIRHALACGLPVVTIDHPLNSAIVGPAAFTIPAGDSRKLGASLITVIVEEEVAQRLSDSARQRAADWNGRDYRARLGEIYRRIVGQ